VTASLSANETRTLLRNVPTTYRAQLDDALLAALGWTLGAWIGERRILVDVDGHGREDIIEGVDVSRTTGWFTSVFPLLLDVEGVPDPHAALLAVREQRRALPEHGIGYGLLRYLRGDSELSARLAAMPRPEVAFNYLGQFDYLAAVSRPFVPAQESPGPPRDPRATRSHLLRVTGILVGGRLQLEWAYSSDAHRRSTVEALVAAYMDTLRLFTGTRGVDVSSAGPEPARQVATFA
jgi:non-ribosomal peptide synthase protein (TIGR01720 family)